MAWPHRTTEYGTLQHTALARCTGSVVCLAVQAVSCTGVGPGVWCRCGLLQVSMPQVLYKPSTRQAANNSTWAAWKGPAMPTQPVGRLCRACRGQSVCLRRARTTVVYGCMCTGTRTPIRTLAYLPRYSYSSIHCLRDCHHPKWVSQGRQGRDPRAFPQACLGASSPSLAWCVCVVSSKERFCPQEKKLCAKAAPVLGIFPRALGLRLCTCPGSEGRLGCVTDGWLHSIGAGFLV